MKFSVLIVSLNAGDKLIQTVESALSQKNADLEIIIKDGGSKDGSLDAVRELMKSEDKSGSGSEAASDKTDSGSSVNTSDKTGSGSSVNTPGKASCIRICEQKDTDIYDGMNQAISEASGDFYIFMNCGDFFYDDMVLARFEKAAAEYIASNGAPSEKKPLILYGSRFASMTGSVEYISPRITPLVCYRNIPCHQAILYSKECFAKRLFRPEYKVRADYEHFLWSVLKNNTATVYVEEPVCRYEGGGYSDNPKQAKRSADEHKEITHMYLTPWQLFYCRLYMIVTLQPLRKKLSSGRLSGVYNSLVKKIYRR